MSIPLEGSFVTLYISVSLSHWWRRCAVKGKTLLTWVKKTKKNKKKQKIVIMC